VFSGIPKRSLAGLPTGCAPESTQRPYFTSRSLVPAETPLSNTSTLYLPFGQADFLST
jgi:hypothetical protein